MRFSGIFSLFQGEYTIAKPTVLALRLMRESDIPAARKFLNDQFAQHKRVYSIYSEERFKHIFMPRKDVIETYIVENNGEVSDFISFYHVPSSCIGTNESLSIWYMFHAYRYFNSREGKLERNQFIKPLRKFGYCYTIRFFRRLKGRKNHRNAVLGLNLYQSRSDFDL